MSALTEDKVLDGGHTVDFTMQPIRTPATARDGGRYDHKDVGGRVLPGARTENNAGAKCRNGNLIV
jgi:hypothetical protein